MLYYPENMAKIVMTTWGSLGDLHPYLAVGIGLKQRGHQVTIATFGLYREQVESEGLSFHKVGPDLDHLLDDREVFRRANHRWTGTQYVIEQLVMPYLEKSYEDIVNAAADADLLVGHPLTYGTRIAAEVLKKKWISTVLQPATLFSIDDPPLYPAAPWLRSVRKLGRAPYRALFNLLLLGSIPWARPIHALRARLGLPKAKRNPIVDVFSPHGTHAWFSSLFSPAQPGITLTGFPFYDRLLPGISMKPELKDFLDNGEPPVIFTLGSSAVNDPGVFYTESLRAIEKPKLRAVFLVGMKDRSQLPAKLPGNVLAVDYVPYSQLFPRSLANVHQGGIGTMAQALRSGRPMIVTPFAHDQPDNAMRAQRLGVARIIRRTGYTAETLERALTGIETLAQNAEEIGKRIRAENGTARACDAIERVLS